jgi:hypothetical protein
MRNKSTLTLALGAQETQVAQISTTRMRRVPTPKSLRWIFKVAGEISAKEEA